MKKAFEKFHKVAVWYSIIFAPITVGFALLYSKRPMPEGVFGWLGNNLGFLWVLSLIYLFLALLFYGDFRDRVMSRIAGFRENDERERLVTADAARSTFLVVLALEILLLIMSLTSFRVERGPDGHGTLSIAMSFSAEQLNIYADTKKESAPPEPGRYVYMESHLLPPNLSLVLLFLLLVQLSVFRRSAQRRYNGPVE